MRATLPPIAIPDTAIVKHDGCPRVAGRGKHTKPLATHAHPSTLAMLTKLFSRKKQETKDCVDQGSSSQSNFALDGADRTEDQGGSSVRQQSTLDQLDSAIQAAMARSGVPLSDYRYRVLALGERSGKYLVVVDAVGAPPANLRDLAAIEEMITELASVRHNIHDALVCWRFSRRNHGAHGDPGAQGVAGQGESDSSPQPSAPDAAAAGEDVRQRGERALAAARAVQHAPNRSWEAPRVDAEPAAPFRTAAPAGGQKARGEWEDRPVTRSAADGKEGAARDHKARSRDRASKATLWEWNHPGID